MLIVRNDDPAGVSGASRFLGDHKSHRATYLSRNKAGGVAMSVYQVDSALDAATSTIVEIAARHFGETDSL